MPTRAGAPGMGLAPDHRLLNAMRADVESIGMPVNMKPAADAFHHRIDSFAADSENVYPGRIRMGLVFVTADFKPHGRAGKKIVAVSNGNRRQHLALCPLRMFD